MKVADNLERHKILDKIEFRQDRTIHFVVICPSAPEQKQQQQPHMSLVTRTPVFGVFDQGTLKPACAAMGTR